MGAGDRAAAGEPSRLSAMLRLACAAGRSASARLPRTYLSSSVRQGRSCTDYYASHDRLGNAGEREGVTLHAAAPPGVVDDCLLGARALSTALPLFPTAGHRQLASRAASSIRASVGCSERLHEALQAAGPPGCQPEVLYVGIDPDLGGAVAAVRMAAMVAPGASAVPVPTVEVHGCEMVGWEPSCCLCLLHALPSSLRNAYLVSNPLIHLTGVCMHEDHARPVGFGLSCCP